MKSPFKLSTRSRQRLVGVHSDLVLVVGKAIELTYVDFMVIEGVRSIKRQQELVSKGVSQTMRSRHLTGHAVDLAPLVDGEIPWHDWREFSEVAYSMAAAADHYGIVLEWGGNWKTFKDGPHFQLPWKDYPIESLN